MNDDSETHNEDMLLALAVNEGGRVDPARIAERSPDSHARQAFERLQQQGCLDSDGWVTPIGKERHERE